MLNILRVTEGIILFGFVDGNFSFRRGDDGVFLILKRFDTNIAVDILLILHVSVL